MSVYRQTDAWLAQREKRLFGGKGLPEAQKPATAAPRKPQTPSSGDKWPVELARQIAQAGLGVAEMEYRFHPVRKWRFDLAFPPPREYRSGLAIEVEGQVHSIRDKRARDMEKSNEALLLGWRVLRVLPEQVKSGEALELVRRALA